MENATIKLEDNYIKIFTDTQRKYFDNNGKEIENTEVFPNLKLYAFEQNGKWGFKDKNGNIKCEAIYDMVTELNSYGFAGIKSNGKWGVINSAAEVILEPTYQLETNAPEFIGKYVKSNSGYGMSFYTQQ